MAQFEIQEARRLDNLSQEDLVKEARDWFEEDIPITTSRISLTNDLMDDFMRYRQDENETQLEEVLKRYDKGGGEK